MEPARLLHIILLFSNFGSAVIFKSRFALDIEQFIYVHVVLGNLMLGELENGEEEM